ncbi:hypothetical protein JD969_16470 [Planctomycetota bacterium]|nr:hypothetical protein JD969_16470 [Planctomycetota bacterium]
MHILSAALTNPSIEYIVIGAYLLFLIAMGAVFKRFNGNIDDYFRSGCKGTWWLVGSSAFMTAFSAWTFTGAAGVAYEAGWSVMIIYLANVIGFIFNALIFAPWFRQIRAITTPEVIRMRYGVLTQQIYAWIYVIIQLLYASLWLYGLAIFCSAVFGFRIQLVIITIGIVVVVYSTAGGSWAVMATDFLQCLILIPITILMAFLCIHKLGGIDSFFTAINANHLSSDFQLINDASRFPGAKFTYLWAAAMFVKNVIGYNTMENAHKYFSVKDGWEARKAATLGAILMTLGALIWFVPPMTARILFANDINAIDLSKPAEASYAVASMRLLPYGLTGLMTVAMFAATMSSMDSGLNKNAGVIVRDIYPRFCKIFNLTPWSGIKLMRLSQGFSVLCGILIILLTVYFSNQDQEGSRGVFEYMLDLGALLALPMAIPLFLGLLIKRTPSWAAIASASCALIPSATAMISQKLYDDPWSFQFKVFSCFICGVLGYFLTILFWKTASTSHTNQVERFFKQMKTPINFANEVGNANDKQQLRILGCFSIAASLFICITLFLPNTFFDRLCILFVASFVGLIGIIFVYTSRQKEIAEPIDLKELSKTTQ